MPSACFNRYFEINSSGWVRFRRVPTDSGPWETLFMGHLAATLGKGYFCYSIYSVKPAFAGTLVNSVHAYDQDARSYTHISSISE
jgi:hypothetical protein